MSLLIINNHDSFTFNLVDLIRRLAVPFQVVNVEELDLNAVEHFSHVLISPGPDVPRAYPQLFDLLTRYHRHNSILGVCLRIFWRGIIQFALAASWASQATVARAGFSFI